MDRKINGFTLVELLAVIGIVVVLMGVLLPALAMSRQNARMIREMAASRQLQQAYLIYPVDHDGTLIPGHCHNTEGVMDDRGQPLSPLEVGNRWPWRLMAYINDGLDGSLLVNEQAQALADRNQYMWTYMVSLYPSFGLNMGNLGGDLLAPGRDLPGCLTKVAQAVKPSRMIVFSSAGAAGANGTTTFGYWRIVAPTMPYEWSAAGWTSEPYRYPRSGSPDRWGYVHPRWDNTAVVSHLDGHSDRLTMKQMRDMTRWSNQAATMGDPNWDPAP